MSSKKLNKIYLKIDSIAKKGDLGKLEYYQFIDELIDKGEFYLFQDVMVRKYGIDISYIETYNIKKKTFDVIRFNTSSKFQEDLKKLYDSKSIYQIGLDIFESNIKLGRIIKSEDDDLYVYRADNINLTLNDPEISLLSKYASASNFLLQ